MNSKGKALGIVVPIIIIALILAGLCIEKIPRGCVGSVYSIRGGGPLGYCKAPPCKIQLQS